MNRALVAAMLMCLAAGTVSANPNDLTGGVLIAHHVPNIIYSPPQDYCVEYGPHAIYNLGAVINQLSGGIDFWYILAAWETEDKTWCGTEFGFGDFDAALFGFEVFAPCFPVVGAGLEIPTPGWPGPNQGTAFVTTGTPWAGNWVPVYSFGGYSYDYTYGTTLIPIVPDPATNFVGFSNCLNPPIAYSVGADQRGAMGINMPGYTPIWPVPPEPWPCCIPTEPYCVCVLEEECQLLGGVWHPGETCAQANCPVPSACCVIGECSGLFQAECELVGGTWMPDVSCTPNPCHAVCCFQQLTSPHGCEIMLEADCLAAGGAWHPTWAECTPINPCEIYTPAENTSWGRIKDLYR